MYEGILAPAAVRLQVRRWMAALAGVLAVALAAAPGLAGGQQFSARTEMVEVYATVTDAEGRLLTDLTADEFVILDDGRPQTISSFTASDSGTSTAASACRARRSRPCGRPPACC